MGLEGGVDWKTFASAPSRRGEANVGSFRAIGGVLDALISGSTED